MQGRAVKKVGDYFITSVVLGTGSFAQYVWATRMFKITNPQLNASSNSFR
jgi:hypothetical protein